MPNFPFKKFLSLIYIIFAIALYYYDFESSDLLISDYDVTVIKEKADKKIIIKPNLSKLKYYYSNIAFDNLYESKLALLTTSSNDSKKTLQFEENLEINLKNGKFLDLFQRKNDHNIKLKIKRSDTGFSIKNLNFDEYDTIKLTAYTNVENPEFLISYKMLGEEVKTISNKTILTKEALRLNFGFIEKTIFLFIIFVLWNIPSEITDSKKEIRKFSHKFKKQKLPYHNNGSIQETEVYIKAHYKTFDECGLFYMLKRVDNMELEPDHKLEMFDDEVRKFIKKQSPRSHVLLIAVLIILPLSFVLYFQIFNWPHWLVEFIWKTGINEIPNILKL